GQFGGPVAVVAVATTGDDRYVAAVEPRAEIGVGQFGALEKAGEQGAVRLGDVAATDIVGAEKGRVRGVLGEGRAVGVGVVASPGRGHGVDGRADGPQILGAAA